LDCGVTSFIHKEALESLAYIYKYIGDGAEASRIRLLLDTNGRNTIRKQFKTLAKEQTLKNCIEYAYGWAVLLYDNAKSQVYKSALERLPMNQKFRKPVLFAAVAIMGDSLLAQSLLAQGVSIYDSVYCS
jgi:hypothetical protein